MGAVHPLLPCAVSPPCFPWLCWRIGPALAQSGANPSSAISAQQESLQNLLNSAIVAIQNNDEAGACQLRSQAFTILNKQLQRLRGRLPHQQLERSADLPARQP